MRYIFKPDEILAIKAADKADPQKIGEALAVIAQKGGGHLLPAAIVEAARERRSVLHRHFEWDDAVAAQSYRLDQARSLVRAIHCENTDAENGMARAFLSIKDKGGTSYRSIDEVLASHDLQQKVLAQAERDLIAFETRFRDLSDVCALVRQARERLSDRRSQLGRESRATA